MTAEIDIALTVCCSSQVVDSPRQISVRVLEKDGWWRPLVRSAKHRSPGERFPDAAEKPHGVDASRDCAIPRDRRRRWRRSLPSDAPRPWEPWGALNQETTAAGKTTG